MRQYVAANSNKWSPRNTKTDLRKCLIVLQIHRSVTLGKGVDMAAELCEFHTEKAIGDIDTLDDGDAKEAIFKILNNLR